MNKEQIMMTALDLFSQHGIKSVSMDDIARNMGISKRTIYEFFEDKETLLVKSIEYNHKKMKQVLIELEEGPYSVVEEIILFYEECMKRPRWYNRKFYDDLKRYPKALELNEKNKAEFSKKCMKLFSRGVKEGVFQKGINFEIVTLLAKEQIKMIRPTGAFLNHSVSEVYKTVLFTFLRGICTEKGLAILDRYALKQSQNLL
ncbi:MULTISPECIES: TetR/AcrR family transcriptional regulator [Parabacteroides]|uniref:TetR/AcrR family transcriptional regulator n=1 Tax=Parabacteroides leei TaxID=2939491 RepID=UPI001897A577|nr:MULTISPECIES: TetR/AcrR family transcriptional regulator [Parabacteroides]MCL3851407.1 TetR/AcrR family transcriptional regulator [Parabacteroides leei]